MSGRPGPAADLTSDCFTDYSDLNIMTGDWLEGDSTTTGQLLLHWAFNEGAGSTIADSSGKGHNGDIYGATWTSPGANGTGYCLDFDGVGNYVLNNDVNQHLDGLDALTVCAWVRSDVNNTDKGFIIFQDPHGDDHMDMRYDAAGGSGGGTNVIKCGITATDGEQLLESSSNVQKVGVWQHVTIVWARGQNLRLYIDGVLNTPTFIQATRSGTLTGYMKLIVGKGSKDTAANQGWDGRIDDVRIYDYELTGAEIITAMNGGTVTPRQIYHPVTSLANIYDAEPVNSKKVDLRDYAVLADTWLEDLFWPPPVTNIWAYEFKNDANCYDPGPPTEARDLHLEFNGAVYLIDTGPFTSSMGNGSSTITLFAGVVPANGRTIIRVGSTGAEKTLTKWYWTDATRQRISKEMAGVGPSCKKIN
jgi:hypothetical protein